MRSFIQISILLFFLNLPNEVIAQWTNQPDGCPENVKMPSAFSPNGDLNNDSLKVSWLCLPEKFEIAVYDKWGVKVFTSEDPAFRWTGDGEDGFKVPAGVYVYSLKYIYLDKEYVQSGNFTLIR